MENIEKVEINEDDLKQLAKETLKTSGLNDAMLHSQDMMREVKEIVRSIKEKNPEISNEDVIKEAREELDQRMASKEAPIQESNEESRD